MIPSMLISHLSKTLVPFNHIGIATTTLFDLELSPTSSAGQSLANEKTFDPILPDSSQIISFSFIVAFSALAVFVWANDVVPISRTKLAKSKRSGAVKEYLEDLQAAGNVTDVARDNTRGFERWLFADWLNTLDRTADRTRKDPALPILKNAKWNSGDNPILAATALILLGVTVTSVLERIFEALKQ